MNAKVLRVLEYDKVIHMLEQKATSDPGRQLCRDLVPMTDLAQIEQAQTETADALTRIFQKGSLNFGSNKPLGMCLRSLEIGSTLSSEELLRIAGLLENTARVKNFGRSDKDEEQQNIFTVSNPSHPFPKKFAAASSMWMKLRTMPVLPSKKSGGAWY